MSMTKEKRILAALPIACCFMLFLSSDVAHAGCTPPNTAITSGPSGYVPSTSATFTFNSPDCAQATFECKLDGGAYAGCLSNINYSGLSQGSHTFYVKAKYVQVFSPSRSITTRRLRRGPGTLIPSFQTRPLLRRPALRRSTRR